MEIIVGDVYSKVADPKKNARGLAIIREVCRARPDGFQFMKKFKQRYWDGYISLMNNFSEFPTGLLDIVVSALERNHIEVKLFNNEYLTFDVVKSDCLLGIELRPYQIEATLSLLNAGRGVARMATGSGKTEIIAAIIKTLNEPKTMIFVHKKDIMYQTAERLSKRLGNVVGVIGDGIYTPSNVTVCMIQTMCNVLNDENKFNELVNGNVCVFVDECHHASSNTTLNVLYNIPGKYRYGFSGTPMKYDLLSDMRLISVTGDVVHKYSNNEFIQDGYSAVPYINIITIEELDDELWKLNYQEAYNKLIVNNIKRNTIISDIALKSTGVVLILVNYVKHGSILHDMIPNSIFVHGSDTTEYRLKTVEDMRNSVGMICIASPIFEEGIDIPNIDTIILAGGGISHIKLLQRIGRGMRKKSGDNILEVYDFLDDTNKYLLEHSDKRINTYVKEKFPFRRSSTSNGDILQECS